MKLKVGDKVKFLNDSGGGIVSKVISSRMVNVSVEDGFDIPTLVSELVLLEPTTYSESMFNEEYNVPIPINEELVEESAESDPSHFPIKGRVTEAEGVYIALVPHNTSWPVSGGLDLYIVNHSSYDILFSLMLKEKDDNYLGYDYNSVESESMILLDSIEREDIEKWQEGVVQILYHNTSAGVVVMPAHTTFQLKKGKLNNESNYQHSGLVDGIAIIYSLNEILNQPKSDFFNSEKENVESKPKKAIEKKQAPIIEQHQTLPKVAVVDLHIGELLDNISGLESRDMFAYQQKYFKECLESAIANNYKKVTFIHGVGNGILKNAIIKRLKEYENVDNQSASLSKFGVGAIDVLIRPWK